MLESGKYSYDTGSVPRFHAADYAVFACTLAISAFIGIFYAIKDRNKQTTDDYLLAGRSMHPFPVAMSLLSSFISAITILGTPAEVYVNSTMYWWISVAMVITALGAGQIFIPIFYKLGITSVFQYIDMRFGRPTRVLASIIYLLWMLLYMAIVLYAPSLALNAVTGLHLWGSVVAVGVVCTFYTAVGGMKAVLWADTVQMVIVYAGLIALIAVGANLLGGMGEVWRIADSHGRIVLLEFDPDPRMRHSVWTVLFGGSVFWCCVFGTNQAQVQRAISVRSLTGAKWSIWLNVPGMASIITVSVLAGLVMFSFYANARCDPVEFGIISKSDQLVPLYMMDILNQYHGLPGLMLSCIFSGSLSTISSGLNAVAAVMLEDFVRPMCCKAITTERATFFSKVFVIAFGLLCLAFAFLVSLLGTMILTLAYVLFGVLGGPLLGIFCLGMLFPWANKWGGFIGLASSLSFLLWIGLGQAITGTSVVITPPVESVGCNWTAINKPTPSPLLPTTTPDFAHPVTSEYDKYDGISRLYTVSYMWYSAIAVLACVVIGLLVSIITGIQDPKELDPKLVCPFFDIFCPYLPETLRRPLRFGVRHGEEVPEEVTSEKRRERLASLHLNDDIGKRASKDSEKSDSVNSVNGTPGEKSEGVENNGYEPQGYEIGNGSTRYQTRL